MLNQIKKSEPIVSIIIVSHNTKKFTLQTIHSVFSTTHGIPFEVIVIEHDSSDGSYAAIQKNFPKITLIKTQKNMGFGASNNIGAKSAKGKYLFFLNSDTVLNMDAVQQLYAFLDTHKDFAVVSGQLLNEDGSIQPQGGALPNLLNLKNWMFFIDDIPGLSFLFQPYQQRRKSFFEENQTMGWVGGTAFLIRSSVFHKIGNWDERIFMYGEDVELCMRLHNMNYQIGLIHGTKITHYGNKSSKDSLKARFGEMQNLLYIWKKHKPSWQMPILKILLFIGSWLRIIVFGILLKDIRQRKVYYEFQKRLNLGR